MTTASSDPAVLRANLAAVRERITRAAERAGRDPREVALVAVTKTADAACVAALARLGHLDVGENRPLDLAAKRAAVEAALAAAPGSGGGAAPEGGAPQRAARPVWHMIGHFQRRKVRPTLASIDVVHSLDSLPLAEALAAASAAAGRTLPVYVQFNVSGEATKGGFRADEAPAALRAIAALAPLRIDGLMTMAPDADDPESVRPVFRRLRELRDWARDSGYLRGPGLSMGMTGDFDIAVEEGATVVRVGRALVGGRQ